MTTVHTAFRMLELLHRTIKTATISAALILTAISAQAEEVYHYYFGNTHAHTYCSDGGPSTAAEHFKLAKANGFDFYAVTDHALAKYPNFTPQTFAETKRQADLFTDSTFVGIAGFEYSENDGPNGTGHLNALNTAGYLDATGSSTYLPVFYDWLVNNQTTTVAASFNHPSTTTYNSYGYFTKARRNPVTMFEVINSGNLHYSGYLAALNKGWRVAPNAGLDNHGTGRITTHFYRTGVLAPSLTRENIMQAMRARRVYCTWDKNLRVMFSANGYVMGSVISNPATLNFRVSVYDPNVNDSNDRITKIEIVGQDGALVASKDFSTHTAAFSATANPQYKYYFAKIYAADKTDGPIAYSAPVWIDNSATPTIPDARAAANGKAADLSGVSVSAAWPDFFYAECDGRQSGIRVEKASHGIMADKRVDVIGTVQTDLNGERYIQASEAHAAGAAKITPLFITNRNLGGAQAGMDAGRGLSNVGLLMTISGKIKYVGPTGEFAYIDDGTSYYDGNSLGIRGVKIIASGLLNLQAGSYASVMGISTITTVGTRRVRALRYISDLKLR